MEMKKHASMFCKCFTHQVFDNYFETAKGLHIVLLTDRWIYVEILYNLVPSISNTFSRDDCSFRKQHPVYPHKKSLTAKQHDQITSYAYYDYNDVVY